MLFYILFHLSTINLLCILYDSAFEFFVEKAVKSAWLLFDILIVEQTILSNIMYVDNILNCLK